jgi:hypothetical protein
MYRIIEWGTGNVGKHALRTIIDRPDFELAGVYVYSPEKVGVDAGTMIGRDPVGIVATNDVEEIIATDADAVCYTALGWLDGGAQALDDMCRLLASGKNVVSCAVEYMAFLKPDEVLCNADPEAYARLQQACAEGGTSVFHCGINPGYAMDMWPMMLSRMCRRIDKLTVSEVVDMKKYSSVPVARDYIGFGAEPDAITPLIEAFQNDLKGSPFYLAMMLLSQAMNVELDDVIYRYEVAPSDRDFETATGTIKKGQVAAMRFHIIGIVNGREAIDYEWVWRMTDDVGTDWHLGASRWLVHIDGDPTLDSEIIVSTTEDSGRAVSLVVAELLMNAIPTICKAEPGIIDNLTLPPHGGGYFLP